MPVQYKILGKSGKILLANGIIGGVCLLVMELTFGSWIYKGQLDQLNIPRNVEFHYENAQTDQAGWQAVYTRDEFGLRGTYTDPARIDILTLGGSTTDQRFLSDNDTWQLQLL